MIFKSNKFLLKFILLVTIILALEGCQKITAEEIINTKKNTTNTNIYNIANQPENTYIAVHENYYPIDELIDAVECTFPDGTKLFTTEGNAQTIVMVNGTYRPDIKTKIINKDEYNNCVLMVPIKKVCQYLNISLKQEDNSITITNNDLTFTFRVNNDVALVNNKNVTLYFSPKIIEGTIYVPWLDVSEILKLKTDYYRPSKLDLFQWNPVITIDQELDLPSLSETEAYNYLKNHLDEAYTHFNDNYKELYNPDNETLLETSSQLKEHIKTLKLANTVSRYYVFKGLYYTIFLDKYNRNVYFYTRALGYADVKKIAFDDPKLFQYYYMGN